MDDNARQTSVATCEGGWLTFSGRARRREYWWKLFLLVSVSVGFIVTASALEYIAKVVYRITVPVDVRSMFVLVFILVTIVCNVLYLSVAVRRLHDCDMSGWWCLLSFSPCLVSDVPLRIVFSISIMLIIGCIDGTCGSNRFGPDPKGRERLPDAGSGE